MVPQAPASKSPAKKRGRSSAAAMFLATAVAFTGVSGGLQIPSHAGFVQSGHRLSHTGLPPTLSVKWTNVTGNASSSPPPRSEAAIAYDYADGYVVMFGGNSYAGELNDTWTYHAGVWKQLFPAVSPPGRRGGGMTYDAADGYVLLFGGSYNNTNAGSNDTWTYKAGVWTQLNLTLSPPARAGDQLVYDSATRSVLMFSGTSDWCCSNAGLHDFWTFSNGSWSQLPLPTYPGQRNEYGFSYDSSRSQAVMFGGWIPGGSCGKTTNTTWLYRSAGWVRHDSPKHLSERQGPAMAFDPTINRSLIFGGWDGTCNYPRVIYFNQTWTFGTSWVQLLLPVHPAARSWAGLVYDAGDGYMLLFGGQARTNFADTWTLG